METIQTHTTTKDYRGNREIVLRDFVRLSWKATRGMTTVAEAEARDMVQRLIQTDRVTSDEGQKLLTLMLSRMQRSRRVFEERVEASVRKAVERLHEISSREITKLETRTGELTARTETLLRK